MTSSTVISTQRTNSQVGVCVSGQPGNKSRRRPDFDDENNNKEESPNFSSASRSKILSWRNRVIATLIYVVFVLAVTCDESKLPQNLSSLRSSLLPVTLQVSHEIQGASSQYIAQFTSQCGLKLPELSGISFPFIVNNTRSFFAETSGKLSVGGCGSGCLGWVTVSLVVLAKVGLTLWRAVSPSARQVVDMYDSLEDESAAPVDAFPHWGDSSHSKSPSQPLATAPKNGKKVSMESEEAPPPMPQLLASSALARRASQPASKPAGSCTPAKASPARKSHETTFKPTSPSPDECNMNADVHDPAFTKSYDSLGGFQKTVLVKSKGKESVATPVRRSRRVSDIKQPPPSLTAAPQGSKRTSDVASTR